MKKQGKVVSWKDDQGFGFIRPDDGGKDVFLHVRDVASRHGRPETGRKVSYRVFRDEKGRLRATQAELAAGSSIRLGAVFEAVCYLVLFFLVLGAVIYAEFLPASFFWIYLTLSVAAFFLYAKDKHAARNRRWRTQESTLHLVSLFGGWPGAMFAQQWLRHKSSKQDFRSVFWLTVLINLLGLAYLISDHGEYWARWIHAILVVGLEELISMFAR